MSHFIYTNSLATTLQMLTRVLRIIIVVELIMLTGFLPTLFNPHARIYGGPGGGWDWSPWSFVGPMGGLMFVTGLGIDTVSRKITNPMYRVFFITMLVLVFASIWAKIVRSE